MPDTDCYKTLGIDKSSTADVIKKAYRKLALKHHPDRNQDDKQAEEKFKEISNAYSILSDPDKKAKYDRFGTVSDHPPPSSSGFDVNFGPDLFEHFFGARRGHAHAQRNHENLGKGSNININVPITFYESVQGCTKNINLNRYVKCNPCTGTGGTGKASCQKCAGRGSVSIHNAGIAFKSSCAECEGTGNVILNKCDTCLGLAKVVKPTTVDIKIPAGIGPDNQLRLSDMGNYGKGGFGHLFVNLNIQGHPRLKREGRDIHSKIDIPAIQAILGCILEVETVYGMKKVNIPPGVQPGNVLNIPDMGMTDINNDSQKGSMKLHLSVVIPKNITEKQRLLYQQIQSDEVDTSD
jgi:molecular chaperone DnaJ